MLWCSFTRVSVKTFRIRSQCCGVPSHVSLWRHSESDPNVVVFLHTCLCEDIQNQIPMLWCSFTRVSVKTFRIRSQCCGVPSHVSLWRHSESGPNVVVFLHTCLCEDIQNQVPMLWCSFTRVSVKTFRIRSQCCGVPSHVSLWRHSESGPNVVVFLHTCLCEDIQNQVPMLWCSFTRVSVKTFRIRSQCCGVPSHVSLWRHSESGPNVVVFLHTCLCEDIQDQVPMLWCSFTRVSVKTFRIRSQCCGVPSHVSLWRHSGSGPNVVVFLHTCLCEDIQDQIPMLWCSFTRVSVKTFRIRSQCCGVPSHVSLWRHSGSDPNVVVFLHMCLCEDIQDQIPMLWCSFTRVSVKTFRIRSQCCGASSCVPCVISCLSVDWRRKGWLCLSNPF